MISKDKQIQTTLLFKGSRDGFKAVDFHKHCDNKGPTVTIIKSEHGKIFGGYTTVSWTSPYDKYGKSYRDKEAFVFSITHATKHTYTD